MPKMYSVVILYYVIISSYRKDNSTVLWENTVQIVSLGWCYRISQ